MWAAGDLEIDVIIDEGPIIEIIEDAGATIDVTLVAIGDIVTEMTQVIDVSIPNDPAILLKSIQMVKMQDVLVTAFSVDGLVDRGKMLRFDNANPVTVTINLDGVYPATGNIVYFTQVGLGQVKIVGAPGVTIETPDGNATRVKHSVIAAVQTYQNKWLLMGDLNYYVV